VYSWQQVEGLVALYVNRRGPGQARPDPRCLRRIYADNLDEDDQVKFKGKAKAFVRSYGFLAAILSYGHPAWESCRSS
jgi:type I restriction enzyme, R subunit